MNQYQAVLLKKLLKLNHIIHSSSNSWQTRVAQHATADVDLRAPSFGVDPRLASPLGCKASKKQQVVIVALKWRCYNLTTSQLHFRLAYFNCISHLRGAPVCLPLNAIQPSNQNRLMATQSAFPASGPYMLERKDQSHAKVDRGGEQQQQHTSLEQYSKFGLVVLYQVLLSATRIVNIPHSNRLKPGLE